MFICQISEAVLASGEHGSRKFRVQNQSPLMYEWYQEQYVGAAHGLSGIYYLLMQVGHLSSSQQQLWRQILEEKEQLVLVW